jgi:hypothetical protein
VLVRSHQAQRLAEQAKATPFARRMFEVARMLERAIAASTACRAGKNHAFRLPYVRSAALIPLKWPQAISAN